MSAPTIDRFLKEIARILRERNGTQLQDYLILEPPLPALYNTLISELHQSFPVFNQGALEAKCNEVLPPEPEGNEGGSWTTFVSFLMQYFAFLRDVNPEQLVETHDMLKSLLNQGILALSDSSMGVVILPTIVSLSRTLARLAIGLDKRPDLVANLKRESTLGTGETEERVTLVESSANVIREAFKKCLNERSGNGTGVENGKPEGRRIGIYLLANLCLKLFFRCRKLRNAEQIFGNIYQQSPPLSLFSKSQRVTFLYYLGRYLFANNHFFRAQLTLQAAYDQCHSKCVSQRRLILVYLISSNIILGRFPSERLLQRPEAAGMRAKFMPICQAIKRGDLASFKSLLDLENENASWFLEKRILLQIQNRCEVLVWRTLARKTFILSGFKGDLTKRAPSLDLNDLLDLSAFLEQRVPEVGTKDANDTGKATRTHTNSIFIFPPPSEKEPNGESHKRSIYVDPDLDDEIDDDEPEYPTMDEVESTVASLVDQGLLHGFVSHKQSRFAITGAKSKPALEAGFPNVWETIRSKADNEVPGWVMDEKRMGSGSGPGTVVHLSGARPVGAVPT